MAELAQRLDPIEKELRKIKSTNELRRFILRGHFSGSSYTFALARKLGVMLNSIDDDVKTSLAVIQKLKSSMDRDIRRQKAMEHDEEQRKSRA